MNRIFCYKNINASITVNQIHHLGHNYGQGSFCKDRKIFAIDIPKNASSAGKHFYNKNNFVEANFTDKDVNPEKFIVIMRDPVQRWVSGVTEYLAGEYGNLKFTNVSDYINNKLLIELIFDQLVFDAHTFPQIAFLEDLKMEKIDFYYHDNDVYNKIAYYNQFDTHIKKSNGKSNSTDKLYVYNRILEELQDPDKLKKVQRMYYCDYKLFDEIKFV